VPDQVNSEQKCALVIDPELPGESLQPGRESLLNEFKASCVSVIRSLLAGRNVADVGPVVSIFHELSGPGAPRDFLSPGSRNTRTVCAANSLGVLPMSRCFPVSISNPSAPLDVLTTGVPSAIASSILRRVPPPFAKATTQTQLPETSGRISFR